jgi:hypothetical protein
MEKKKKKLEAYYAPAFRQHLCPSVEHVNVGCGVAKSTASPSPQESAHKVFEPNEPHSLDFRLKMSTLPIKITDSTTSTRRAMAATIITLIEMPCPFLSMESPQYSNTLVFRRLVFKCFVNGLYISNYGVCEN